MFKDKIKLKYSDLEKEPIAYFSAEYALFGNSHLYAGGLGILAGDYFLEMTEQDFPVVAFGLLYRQAKAHVESYGLTQVLNNVGDPLTIIIPIGDRDVLIRAFVFQKGRARLFLLDTDVDGNHPEDVAITNVLYDENRDVRLMQEIVLGIGGMRFLRELGIHPSVFHMNEGHSAFLALELIRHEMRRHNLNFATAYQYARQHIVFTNHTLVPEGQEIFAIDKVNYMLHRFAEDIEVALSVILSLGKFHEKDSSKELFSMTSLALNMSYKINAVSVLHSIKAGVLWKDYQISAVTNGINVPRWDSIGDGDSKVYKNDVDDAGGSVEKLWQKHQENKRHLIDEIKKQTGVVFDENILLLGWARRFVEYKNPLAILSDVARFKKIAEKTGQQVRIVFSGPVGLDQRQTNPFLKTIMDYAENELRDILVFLPNYNLELAKILVAGCDVWINTPHVGREACGTSGMKACLNGNLPLSTRDGWIYETDLSQIGWVVDDVVGKDPLTILESEIAPMYYNSQNEWKTRMKDSRDLILEKFSTTRMLIEYADKLYLPVFQNKEHLL